MSVGSVRRAVIADNIANAETPNFKRSTVSFESEAARAIESQKVRPALELARTDPAHFSNHRERKVSEVQLRRVLDFTSMSRNNGNNVDLEQEIGLAVQNEMTYGLLAQSIDFEFSQISRVLRG